MGLGHGKVYLKTWVGGLPGLKGMKSDGSCGVARRRGQAADVGAGYVPEQKKKSPSDWGVRG